MPKWPSNFKEFQQPLNFESKSAPKHPMESIAKPLCIKSIHTKSLQFNYQNQQKNVLAFCILQFKIVI